MIAACFLTQFTSTDPAAGIEPDYSDSDNDNDNKPEVEADGMAPPSSNNDNNALSEDEWAKIVASAGLLHVVMETDLWHCPKLQINIYQVSVLFCSDAVLVGTAVQMCRGIVTQTQLLKL